jgi:small acid-soluble spore protein F (minor alpha/beta-type SASP)
MTIVERAIRRAKRAAGYDTRDLQSQIAARDPRWLTFCRAVEYINYEAVAGDIVIQGQIVTMDDAGTVLPGKFAEISANLDIGGFFMSRQRVMSEALKDEIARRLGVDAIVSSEGWGGVSSRNCGNIVRTAIEMAEESRT